MLIVGDPASRMCKAGDVSLTLTLLEKEGFENRIELFEYRDKLTASINFEYCDRFSNLSPDKYNSRLRENLRQGLRNRDFYTNRPRLLKFGLVE